MLFSTASLFNLMIIAAEEDIPMCELFKAWSFVYEQGGITESFWVGKDP